jgi:hypothetical protein
MSMITVGPEGAEAKSRVLDALISLYPSLSPYLHRPVRDYATYLYGFERPNPIIEARTQAFEKLLAAIERAACRAGLSREKASSICLEFASRPVLQTGPHLMLSIDPDAYYTHAFSLLGLMGQGCSNYVSYAVSTVSLSEKSKRGPGWPSVDGKAINLFGMSQNQLKSQNLLSRAGPYSLKLEATDQTVDFEVLAWLRDIMPCGEFETPACAIRSANRALWPKMFSSDITMLQIDDEDIADLVADHLSDESSWLRRRLFKQRHLAEQIVAEVEGLEAGPWAGWLGRGTDFFWHYDKGRRRPLRLSNGNLVGPTEGRIISRFAFADVGEKLENKTLIPNLLLMFLVAAILPGIRVPGGSRHPIYYALMRFAVARALRSSGLDGDLTNALAEDILPGAWGHRVIEGDHKAIFNLPGRPAARDFWGSDLAAAPLFAACRAMTGFVSDQLWCNLVARISEGIIGCDDAEWTYAGVRNLILENATAGSRPALTAERGSPDPS